LRDYIINLQSRLLETQGEIPPAPAGVDLNRPHGEPANIQPQPPQPPQQHQQQPEPQPQQEPNNNNNNNNNNNGGLSERQIGELQMAAQAAAAAQHGPDVSHGKHSNSEGSYDYAEKRQKMDESPQGQLPSPTTYPDPSAY
jgi:hypothetical protein